MKMGSWMKLAFLIIGKKIPKNKIKKFNARMK
jgi:hypothetical protein